MNFFKLLLIILKLAFYTTADSVDDIHESIDNNSNLTNTNWTNNELALLIEQLKTSNVELAERVAYLENKHRRTERLVDSLNSDINFFHPTVEYVFVDMNVLNWEQVVEGGLDHVSMSFDARLPPQGTPTTWTLSLTENKKSLSVHVTLETEPYNEAGALYTGFTLYILDKDDNTAFTKTLGAMNILENPERTLSILSILPLSAITNSDNGLLRANGAFKLRLRLELLANGHKLYFHEFGNEAVSRDTQTILFEISFEKLREKRESEEERQLGFTRFELAHPWGWSSEWVAQVTQKDNSSSLVLSLVNEHGNWPQLFASLKVKISLLDGSGGKETLSTRLVGLHDYKKESVLVEHAITANHLSSILIQQEGKNNSSLEFKLYLTVFNRNARLYVDL